MANYSGDECSKYAIGSGYALSPVQFENHRQSDRVFLTLPIRVLGAGSQGKDFLEEGQTVDVSRQGAAIMVDRELFAGQYIKIQRVGVGKEAMASGISTLISYIQRTVPAVNEFIGPAELSAGPALLRCA